MRKISLALAFIAGLFALPAQAANFSAKDAAAATIIFTNPGNCTTGCTPIFAWSDSTGANLVAVLTAGADGASNTANGGLTYSRNMVFNGTTWDRWLGDATNGGFVNVKTSVLPTGAATAAKQPALGTAASPSTDVITVTTPTVPVVTMNSASANSGVTAANAYVFDDVSPTAITENSFGFARMSANRNTYQTIRDAAGNERGANVNASNQLAVAEANSAAIAASVASIDTKASLPLPAQSGTTVNVGMVTHSVAANGGATPTGNIAANNTTAVVIKASAGTLYGVQMAGIGSAPAYLKIYNATSATCGSGTPVKRLMIPAASTAANGAGSNITFGVAGVAFGTGITYCITTGIGDADTTAPAASTFLVNLDWN